MSNLRSLSWPTVVVLLRATGIAVVLLVVVAAYTKTSREPRPVVAAVRMDDAASRTASEELARCQDRYARAEVGEQARAEAALTDCIESEP
jgi:hypothetical protein